MKTLLVGLLIFGFAANLVAKEFRSDYIYFPDAGGWLGLHIIPADWYEARLRCHLEGGNLASPSTSGLRSAMSSLMNKPNSPINVFTGIHSTFSRGDFFTVEGIPLERIPHTWGYGEPNNWQDQESCILLTAEGTFADVFCNETYSYICFKKTNDASKNECGSTDPAYTLDKRTGSCYKFHGVPRIYSRAFMACAAEGSYLTIINSDAEAQVIKEIFAKNPPSSMIGNFWKDVAFVGFHDWGEHGEWLTIHGQTLQEAGYAKFSAGEPNNSTGGEYCGSVYRSALLNDLWCDRPVAFICEKNPASLKH